MAQSLKQAENTVKRLRARLDKEKAQVKATQTQLGEASAQLKDARAAAKK